MIIVTIYNDCSRSGDGQTVFALSEHVLLSSILPCFDSVIMNRQMLIPVGI